MISCQKTNATQKLKLLDEILRYNLYYSLTVRVNHLILNLLISTQKIINTRK